ncbi:MAG TPA: type II secretion system protein [Phycisphaerae bacterium]|nr:type II secretion system protein [Phycisphaerae bacterium]
MRRQCPGFTLVELLVVIAIIGVLAGLLFPAAGGIWASAYEAKCQNHMRQLAEVIRGYCAENQGSFPLLPQGQVQAKGSASNWLYGLRDAAGNPDFTTGILWRHKYIGTDEILYCPKDRNMGLPRNKQTAIKEFICKNCGAPVAAASAVCTECKQKTGTEERAPTSYVINGSITYGGGSEGSNRDARLWSNDPMTAVRSRNIAEFEPTDFLFIEQSSGVEPDVTPSHFNTGYMTPNSGRYALTNRHRGGGFVACMDGHVEPFTSEQFTEGMRTLPQSGEWWRVAPRRPSGVPQGKVTPEELGARWNPG